MRLRGAAHAAFLVVYYANPVVRIGWEEEKILLFHKPIYVIDIFTDVSTA